MSVFFQGHQESDRGREWWATTVLYHNDQLLRREISWDGNSSPHLPGIAGDCKQAGIWGLQELNALGTSDCAIRLSGARGS